MLGRRLGVVQTNSENPCPGPRVSGLTRGHRPPDPSSRLRQTRSPRQGRPSDMCGGHGAPPRRPARADRQQATGGTGGKPPGRQCFDPELAGLSPTCQAWSPTPSTCRWKSSPSSASWQRISRCFRLATRGTFLCLPARWRPAPAGARRVPARWRGGLVALGAAWSRERGWQLRSHLPGRRQDP